jgi:predicted aspartyl protease
MVTMTRRQAAGAAAIGALIPGSVMAQAEHVQFPFRVTRNQPWTSVSLNHKPPVPFLLDMGAGWFLVDDAYATSLGLPYAGDLDHVQTAGGETRLRSYQVEDLLVGGRLREQGVTVQGWRPSPGKLVKGIIPASHYGVIGFDFDAQTITADRSLRAAPVGYEKIDLGNRKALGSGSHLANDTNISQTVVFAKVNGKELRLIVDTGATDSLFLFPPTVRDMGLWDKYPNFIAGRTSTIAGLSNMREVKIDSLEVGRFKFEKPLTSLAEPTAGGGIGDEAEGLIGIELLRRMNFILDPDRRAVWVRPSKAIDDVYRYDRSGVAIQARGEDIRVVGLEAGLPGAKAGLRVGDKVTGWAGEGGYFGLLWALQGAPGDVVRIQVERDGKPEVIDVTLQERL